MPYDPIVWRRVKEHILLGPWNEVLDLLESFVMNWEQVTSPGVVEDSAGLSSS